MEKLRVGVVGAGFIGVAHIEALRRLGYIDVVALADPIDVAQKAERLSIPHSFTNHRDMLDTLELDAVHICTPNHLHREIAVAALEKGVHVICEKPFCCTLEEADAMVEAAERSGKVCAVNYHNRFYPMAFQLHRMVEEGELGKVFSVHGEYLQDWLLYDTDFSWRLLASKGGNTRAYSDIGSHWVDLSEFILGQRVTQVFAEFKTCYPVRKAPTGPVETFGSSREMDYEEHVIDTEDICMVLLRYEDGALGELMVSQVFAGAKNGLTISVAGQKQSATWGAENCCELSIGRRDAANGILTKSPELLDPQAAKLAAYPGGHGEGFPDAFKQHFHRIYQHILHPERPADFASFSDGRRLLLIGEKLLESAKCGRWIDIE